MKSSTSQYRRPLIILIVLLVVVLQLLFDVSIVTQIFKQQRASVHSGLASNSAGLPLQPATDVANHKQYLVAAGLAVPLDDSTKDLIYSVHSKLGEPDFRAYIGKASAIQLSDSGDRRCDKLLAVVSDESAVGNHSVGSVQVGGQKLFIGESYEPECNGAFTKSDLDGLVKAVQAAETLN